MLTTKKHSSIIYHLKSKIKVILLGIGIFSLFFVSFAKADFTDFLNQLETMDIPVEQIMDADGISRYTLSRLLNAVECEDCIYPSQTMVNSYSSSFWSQFSQLPGKDFDDIVYLGGNRNQTSYYYCVAYVGDNNYMRGYPATSQIAAGQFRGDRNVIKAEFLQVVINIIAKYIYTDLMLDRDMAKNRFEGLDSNSDIHQFFTQDDIQIIEDNAALCESDLCASSQPKEVETYLKYCRFNLSKCGMSPLGNVPEGNRPVSELNLLYKQNVIDLQEVEKEDINDVMDGKRILEILYNLFNITDCGFINDYDCDGLDNSEDNCANDFNAHQGDMDNDGIGDSCDDDIDNDGIKNPIGIVDDNGNFNIAALQGRDGVLDNCLFTVNTDQTDLDGSGMGDACEGGDTALSLYINVEGLEGSAPVTLDLDAITKGKHKGITWDLGDGNIAEGQQIQHTFEDPGMYVIKAFAEGDGSNDASAQNVIVIGGSMDNQQAMQISSNVIGGDTPLEIDFTVSTIGDIDQIQRIWDQDTMTTSLPQQGFKKLFSEAGAYSIGVKMLKDDEIIAVSNFVIGVSENAPGSMLKSNMLNPNIGDQVDFQTISYGFQTADINYVQWEFGDGTLEKNKLLSMSHNFSQRGPKVVIQTIVLKNDLTLTNFITLFIVDPSLLASYVLQTQPNKLNPNTLETINYNSILQGDTLNDYITFLQSYDPQITETSTTTTFPFDADFIYNKGGVYHPQTLLYINECLYLESQSTLAIHSTDTCLEAQLQGNLEAFACDMDEDGIPDICDNDIDGDGIENLLGIIKYENGTCSIIQAPSDDINNVTNGALDQNNTNLPVLDTHFQGVCELDNAPFYPNVDQLDLNNDGMGDVGNNGLSDLLGDNESSEPDSDGDGIPDYKDSCPEIKENYNTVADYDGCPEIGEELACDGEGITDIEDLFAYTPLVTPTECYQCPCQFSDITANLTTDDQIQAVLRDKEKKIPYTYSLPWIFDINE